MLFTETITQQPYKHYIHFLGGSMFYSDPNTWATEQGSHASPRHFWKTYVIPHCQWDHWSRKSIFPYRWLCTDLHNFIEKQTRPFNLYFLEPQCCCRRFQIFSSLRFSTSAYSALWVAKVCRNLSNWQLRMEPAPLLLCGDGADRCTAVSQI